MLKPFSENISVGNVESNKESDQPLFQARERTLFEQRTKDLIDELGSAHPKGVTKFIKGLDKGLKHGIAPRELEIVWRTYISGENMVSDPRQKEILELCWPGAKNEIDDLISLWEGETCYPLRTPLHKEGIHEGTYAEKVREEIVKTEMDYHRDVGFY
jgi:hypothetical protein